MLLLLLFSTPFLQIVADYCFVFRGDEFDYFANYCESTLKSLLCKNIAERQIQNPPQRKQISISAESPCFIILSIWERFEKKSFKKSAIQRQRFYPQAHLWK